MWFSWPKGAAEKVSRNMLVPASFGNPLGF
jgi:hypothetical protein